VLVDDEDPGVEGADDVPCTVDDEGCKELANEDKVVLIEDGPGADDDSIALIEDVT